MDDEVHVVLHEGGRRIRKSWIQRLYDAIHVQVPHGIRQCTSAHLGLQPAKSIGRPNIDGETDYQSKPAPEFEALPPLCQRFGFVTFLLFGTRQDLFDLFSDIVKRLRQALPCAILIHRR
jgi:hypothetical protein